MEICEYIYKKTILVIQVYFLVLHIYTTEVLSGIIKRKKKRKKKKIDNKNAFLN